MPATGSERVEGTPWEQQVEALQRDCAALMRALERARTVRTVLLVAMLVFVAAAAGMFYSLGRRLQDKENLDRLRTLAEERLAKNSDRYLGELRLLVDHASPVLTDAFYKRAKEDLPSFLHAAGQERERFAQEMQARVAERLDAQYRRALERHRKLLEAEFPRVKDKELHQQMVGNLALACDRLVKKYYVDELQGQLVGLYDAWDHFPAADAPGKGGPALEDLFIAHLLELLTLKLTETQSLAAK